MTTAIHAPMLLIGMLLYAKDGESFGNGIIYGRFRREGQFVYQIETDFGNRIERDYAGVKQSWSHSKEPMCVTTWREDRMKRIQTPFIAPAGDPQFCPYCSGLEIREVNGISVVVTSNAMSPGEKAESMDLDEWQCHGDCGGRSFWV